MKILQRLLEFFTKNNYPKHLLINGRKKLPTTAFKDDEKLFRSFDKDYLDEDNNLKLEAIRFPDISCNWSRFSFPKDILFIENAKPTNGCYSFTVSTSRYKEMATPVHDPIEHYKYPNYSHVEVRELQNGENVFFEPPKERKLKTKSAKSKRLEYRQNLLKSLYIEFEAK